MREVSPVGPNGFTPPYYAFGLFKKIRPRFKPYYEWQNGENPSYSLDGFRLSVRYDESFLNWNLYLQVEDCDVKHRPWASVTVSYKIYDNDDIVLSSSIEVDKDPGGTYVVKGDKIVNREELNAYWYSDAGVEGMRNDYDSVMSVEITGVSPSSPYKPPL